MAKKQEQAEETTAENKGKGVSKVLIIILALLVLGAGSFGGVYLFLNNKSAEEKVITETKVEILKEVTVNLDAGGFLKTSLVVSFDEDNSKLADEITAKTVEIQDKAIFFLKARKYDEFKSDNEVKLKQDLIAQINTVLTKGELVNVYFPAGIMVQK